MYKKYCVYIHINKTNDKKYIGITSKPPKQRWDNGKGYLNNPYFNHSIEKYGWDNFEHKVLFENLTKEESKITEIEMIEKFNTLVPNGYNLTKGGDYNWKNSRRIICIETNEIFDTEDVAFDSHKSLFGKKYNKSNISDCCNNRLPYLKNFRSNKKIHYQFTRNETNTDIDYIENLCMEKAIATKRRNMIKFNGDCKYHFKINKETRKHCVAFVENICCNCGNIYRSNRASHIGICDNCKKHKIKILKKTEFVD